MKKQNIKAPRDMVIVEPVYAGKVEGSKLIITADRDTKYIGDFHGIVVAVGPQYKHGLKIGQKVIFRRHEGTPIEIDGVEFISLQSKWVEALDWRK